VGVPVELKLRQELDAPVELHRRPSSGSDFVTRPSVEDAAPAQEPEADRLRVTDPLALLVGMLLDHYLGECMFGSCERNWRSEPAHPRRTPSPCCRSDPERVRSAEFMVDADR
jgi:hypothetical protein